MTRATARSIAGHLATEPRLEALMRHAQRLDALTRSLLSLLPAAATGQCRVAACRDGHLMVEAASGAWASRLHHLAPRIRTEVRRVHGVGVSRLSVRVRPMPSTKPRANARRLSGDAARSLREAAASVSDPGLRAALQRLARHTGTPDT